MTRTQEEIASRAKVLKKALAELARECMELKDAQTKPSERVKYMEAGYEFKEAVNAIGGAVWNLGGK